MKTIEFKNHKIVIYASIETLPIKRYQKFNKFLMIDNEVGSCFEDYDVRTSKAVEFLRKDLKEEAIQELENRRQAVFNSFEEYSPKNNAFAILVHSIDDKIYSNYSDEGIKEVIDKLDEIGYNRKELDKEVSEVKKK